LKIKISARYYAGKGVNSVNINIDSVPDRCPVCHKYCDPRHHNAWLANKSLQQVFGCTNNDCQSLFIAYYEYPGDERTEPQRRTYLFKTVAPISFEERKFPKIINKISPQFSKIYNEAKEAEDIDLENICGAGYRKAIEFLIKDYLINVKKQSKEEIKKKFLGRCIEELIENENIKKCAIRAVWIGNDETHYIRKWEDKDLQDLKDLIDVTLNWIEMEYKTERWEIDMPEKGQKEKDK